MPHLVCPACSTVNRVAEERLAAEGLRAKCARCGTPLVPGRPADVAGEALGRVVERSGVPVVVDCWAAWCGPCRAMAPAFAEAAAALAPRAQFLKLDTDAAPEVAGRLGIRSIPTLILFSGGREVARQSGVMSAGQIARWVTQAL